MIYEILSLFQVKVKDCATFYEIKNIESNKNSIFILLINWLSNSEL